MSIQSHQRLRLVFDAAVIGAISCTMLAAAPALAQTRRVELHVSDPLNSVQETVKITFTDTAKPDGDPHKSRTIDVQIPGNSDAERKEELISQQLTQHGVSNVRDIGGHGVILTSVNKHVRVSFDNGGTMEHDVVHASQPQMGRIGFVGFFDPIGGDQLPAVFTAGVVTDLGECSVQVTADELLFQTDGPTICQELLLRLAPQAQQLGAQVVCVGDSLEVFFDPQLTLARGGVAWGTTSPSEGCGGQLLLGFPELRLEIDQLIAGQVTTFGAFGAEPGERVFFTYAFDTGWTYIPQLDVTLDLLNPKLLGSAIADPLGSAQLPLLVPPVAQGLELHFQALVLDGTSQVRTERVR